MKHRPSLFINHIPELDWLIALEFGRVDEGQPEDHWIGVTDTFGYLCDSPQGSPIGFKILDFSALDLDDPALVGAWGPPYFDAPTLGLTDCSAAEIAFTARTMLGSTPTVNRLYFNEALESDSKHDEAGEWMGCLEAGDCMAHYGLGICLFEMDMPERAYGHLRFYARIAPMNAWAHHWHGRAALEIGEVDEARAALQRSLELETDEELMNQSRVLLTKIT
ncbi:MAG: hypothetical protein WAP35_02115 [Solirubrobacterales bacterium]